MKLKSTTAFILFLVCALSLFSQTRQDIIIGHTLTIYSDSLNQDREVHISLPKSYADTVYSQKSYPVLYVLDAQEHFDMATGTVRFMSTRLDSKLIPEFIIVGIKSINRIKDFTPTYSITNPYGEEVESFKVSGGADRFISFMQHELIPVIEKNYRTIPYKILVGHSLGGLLAIYDNISSNPGFNAYIAMDPNLWWDNGLPARSVESAATEMLNNSVRKLYISGAHNSPGQVDTTPMRKNQMAFYKSLQSKLESASKVEYRIYPNEDHGTVPLPSLYDGLKFIFENYKMTDMLSSSTEQIKEHFRRLSGIVGIQLRPDERVIDILGNYFIEGADDPNKGIELLKMNTLYYPESYHAFYALAKAENQIGNTANAIMYYKKSIALKPENIKALQELQQILKKN